MARVSNIDRPVADLSETLRQIRSVAATGTTAAVRRALFDAFVEHLHAVGGAIWFCDSHQKIQLVMQYGLGAERIDAVHDRWPGHRELLSATLAETTPRFASAAFEPDATTSDESPRQFSLLLYPWRVGGRPPELLELFFAPQSLDSPDRAVAIVRQLCEAAAAVSVSDAPAETTVETSVPPAQLAAFVQAVHSSLDIERVAITAANDGRKLLGCDRLSIATGCNRSLKMTAISGLTSFDRRSPAVRALESLGRSVQIDSVPCFHSASTSDTPEGPLSDCIEQISPAILHVVPLEAQNDGTTSTVGVLFAEHFDDGLDADRLKEQCLQIAPAIAAAVANATRYEGLVRIPLIGRMLKAHHEFGRAGWSGRLFALLLLVALAILLFVPADLEISGRARLQPLHRRPVYASSNGVIEELLIDHAATVNAGQPLIRLRNRELDFEISRVDGELQTVLQQIADVQALRARPIRSATSPSGSADELAAREQELTQVRDSLTTQLEILRQQEQDLTLTSPLDGQVLTWNVREQLESRPVETGQRLLTIGDVDGPWVVEMHVRDRDIGHVREAQSTVRPDLDVDIVLPGDPPVRHHGTVRSITETVEYDELDGPTVLVTVDIDAEQIESPRPGTTVAARIQCGRARLGYVLFRQVIDAVRTWWAF